MGGRSTASGPGRPPRGHARRRAARRQAVDLLYQADVMGRPGSEVIREWRQAGRPILPYAEELVAGVEADLARIDRQLGAASEGWTVARMAAVDRSILRVACHELRAGIPVAVAINEAVEAANELSTEDSGRFVNGVLGRLARSAGSEQPG